MRGIRTSERQEKAKSQEKPLSHSVNDKYNFDILNIILDTALRLGRVKPQSARGAHTVLLPAGDGALPPDLKYRRQERKPASRLYRERGPDGGCGEAEPTETEDSRVHSTAVRV
ncbi:hypothetical protein E5288_WYG015363 [Bos mutus]|uniref:Uncharacterized protein n=1 Tax=Bos mutus TaxID=72004 RepID=A0A6B0RFP6_9CETA|nr:hypothetical protein [Bos mutus]